jgi:hypothetical protein
LLAGGLVFIFDEGVLETVAGAFVADYFAGQDFAKAGEDQFEVLI